jgi:hypothetical protein
MFLLRRIIISLLIPYLWRRWRDYRNAQERRPYPGTAAPTAAMSPRPPTARGASGEPQLSTPA